MRDDPSTLATRKLRGSEGAGDADSADKFLQTLEFRVTRTGTDDEGEPVHELTALATYLVPEGAGEFRRHTERRPASDIFTPTQVTALFSKATA